MNYFVSDLHFGHSATLYCFCRPFLSVEDMDAYLVQQWNKRVAEEDTVYICGDISFYDITKTKALIRRLKGKKILIFGNHDAELQADPELPALFTEWGMMLERVIDGRHICLTHYPMLDWPGDREGGWLIYGHIHNREYGDTYDYISKQGFALNCGVDINRFMPVTFEELWENNVRFYGLPRAPFTEEDKAENEKNHRLFWEKISNAFRTGVIPSEDQMAWSHFVFTKPENERRQEIEYLSRQCTEEQVDPIGYRRNTLRKRFLQGFLVHNFKREDYAQLLDTAFQPNNDAWKFDTTVFCFFTECRAVISKLAIEGERVFAIIRIPAEAAFSVVAEILSILKQACAQKASFQFGVQHDFSLSEDECKVDIIGLTLM